MQRLLTWSVCFILAGSLAAQEGNDGNDAKDKKTAAASPTPAGASTVVVIYLSDGSRITGTTAIDRLKINTKLATMEFQLSRSRMIVFSDTNHVARVNLQNGDLLNGELAVTEIAVKTDSGQVAVPLAKVGRILIRADSIRADFVNSLGMEFVFVPGTNALFSIWDTRVRDYRAYAKANPGVDGKWKNPGVPQTDDHPVIGVNWDDANAFCAWLTKKERHEGRIADDQEYRLPTDKEWSVAAGPGKYPWGNDWPPPKGAGSFRDSNGSRSENYTSPVGSFKPNEFGLYDMGGNVLQWCEDWYRGEMNAAFLDKNSDLKDYNRERETFRVARGSTGWTWSGYVPWSRMSSYHNFVIPSYRDELVGIRCVLAPVADTK